MRNDHDALQGVTPPTGARGALSRRRVFLRLLSFVGPSAIAPWSLGMPSGSARAATSATASPVAPRVVTLHSGLVFPWGMDFLPDGRMLVTQKAGTMVILSADGKSVLAAVDGLPPVMAEGMGGLLDVVIDPEFARDPWVYWAYSEAGSGAEAGKAATSVARGRLAGSTLRDVSVLFRQGPKVGGASHFGARLAFRGDGTLFIALGDRKQLDPPGPTQGAESLFRQFAKAAKQALTFGVPMLSPQSLATDLGKVVRINRDGTMPADNPKFDDADARPEIWSYGHRNPQGAAIHPDTGELWIVEHGPQGGDELNRVLAGGNYGWPLKSYGCPYGSPVGEACRIGGGTHAPAYIEPVSHWVPISIAPSGLMFYTGNRFPEWRGNAFIGALAGTALWRVALSGNQEVSRERLFADLGERIRCVRQGPDGWIYLLTGSGKLMRIER